MDPRLEAVDPKKTKLTPLMWAKSRASSGRLVNACPFDSNNAHLDANGYCRHLVGFSNDGKFYEPLVMGARGHRVVQCNMIEDEELSEPGGEPYLIPELLAVQEGDLLIPISVSSRVYRNVPRKPHANRSLQLQES